jgi:hypothetical protein
MPPKAWMKAALARVTRVANRAITGYALTP